MAIIQCPACNKRISDKATSCNHCGSQLKSTATHSQTDTNTDTSADSKTDNNSDQKTAYQPPLSSQIKLKRLKLRYSLQMQASASVLLFLISIFIWYFVGNRGFSNLSHYIQIALAVIGAIWYVITRIRIIQFNRGR